MLLTQPRHLECAREVVPCRYHPNHMHITIYYTTSITRQSGHVTDITNHRSEPYSLDIVILSCSNYLYWRNTSPYAYNYSEAKLARWQIDMPVHYIFHVHYIAFGFTLEVLVFVAVFDLLIKSARE